VVGVGRELFFGVGRNAAHGSPTNGDLRTKPPAGGKKEAVPTQDQIVHPVPVRPTTTPVGGELVVDAPAYRDALDSRRASLAAMPEQRVLRRSRLDPTEVHQLAMAAAVKSAPFRGELVAQFGAVAGETLDDLTGSAMAAKQADIELQMAEVSGDLGTYHREVSTAYELLIGDADSLVRRGHLPAASLERARDTRGYQAAVDSLMKVVHVLRESWSRIQGLTPITTADLDRGEKAALTLSRMIAMRDQGALRAPAAEVRVRALSHVIHGYEQLRRMMTYLRWSDGDVDSIVPSLYVGRGRRTANDVDEPTEDVVEPAEDVVVRDEPAAPVTPSPNNGGPPFTA